MLKVSTVLVIGALNAINDVTNDKMKVIAIFNVSVVTDLNANLLINKKIWICYKCSSEPFKNF